jgi:hypothetical protein
MFRTRVDGDDCIYCGNPRTCWDHFPPHSYTLTGYLLPACLECNKFASNHHPTKFEARRELVKRRIREEYRAVLETPYWSPEELEPLGDSLRLATKAWSALRREVEARLAYYSDIEFAEHESDD